MHNRNSRVMMFGAVAAFSAAFLPSCALPEMWASRSQETTGKPSAPLQAGTKYEVRKALGAGVPFKPSEIKRYTFVFDEPRPPLMAASTLHRGTQMRVRTTAYTHDESDHIVYGVKSAVGTNLKFGNVRSAAADWSRFPVGTKFRIAGQPGIVYEVDDYGSALVGTGTIDLYKPSQSQMNNWGVRHVDIEVIQWGSFQRSMELMRDRTKWRHVRAMMEDIQTRLRTTAGLTATKQYPVTASL